MNKPDIATIIDLHFEELTSSSKKSLVFLQAETIQDDLSSQPLPRNYISPKQP